MRARILTAGLGAALALWLWGCSEEEPAPADGGHPADAGQSPDAGPTGPTTPCGELSCVGEEFCLVRPEGPCEPSDGGTCPPSEESCEDDGVPGCTPPQARSCEALPSSCRSAPSCTCLIVNNPCPGPNPDCLRAAGAGFRVECPF